MAGSGKSAGLGVGMLRRRIGATVSAMIVAMQLGSPPGGRAYGRTTRRDQGDTGGERRRGAANLRRALPELLEGDTQLADLLRKFLLESKHLPNYLLSDSDGQGAPTREEPPAVSRSRSRLAATGGTQSRRGDGAVTRAAFACTVARAMAAPAIASGRANGRTTAWRWSATRGSPVERAPGSPRNPCARPVRCGCRSSRSKPRCSRADGSIRPSRRP